MSTDFHKLLSQRVEGKQLRFTRCPKCSALPGLCKHLTRQGHFRKNKKSAPAQAQKYSLNPLWRGRRGTN